jgi:hypothetical protein
MLADGRYLMAWPRIGSFAPPAALLVGLLVGWSHWLVGPGGGGTPTAADTYTGSILAMALFIALGIMSNGLGIWFVIGYAVGDLFFYPHAHVGGMQFWRLIHVQTPLLISYVWLFAFIAVIPFVAHTLGSLPITSRHGRRGGSTTGTAANVMATVLVQAGLVFAWAISMPILIRPVFTWSTPANSAGAVEPLQHYGWVLVIVAAVMAWVRLRIEDRAGRATSGQRFTQASARARTFARRKPRSELPLSAGVPLRAAGTTLIFGGALTSPLDAVGAATFFLLYYYLRDGPLARSTSWTRALTHVPYMLRFLAAIGIGFGIGLLIMRAVYLTPAVLGSFRPILYASAITLLLTLVLSPPATALPRRVSPNPKRAS